jgi:hypothetical protein
VSQTVAKNYGLGEGLARGEELLASLQVTIHFRNCCGLAKYPKVGAVPATWPPACLLSLLTGRSVFLDQVLFQDLFRLRRL